MSRLRESVFASCSLLLLSGVEMPAHIDEIIAPTDEYLCAAPTAGCLANEFVRTAHADSSKFIPQFARLAPFTIDE